METKSSSPFTTVHAFNSNHISISAVHRSKCRLRIQRRHALEGDTEPAQLVLDGFPKRVSLHE